MKLSNSLRDWHRSFSHAIAGFKHLIRTEKNFRIHLFFAATALALLLLFRAPIVEWALILLVIGLVISAEILNTAIEVMVDIYSPSYHPLAKISKDLGAAAVLFTAVISILIGMLVFIPHLLALLQ